MKIFLAHAKEDEAITEGIYEKLKYDNFNPWMDIKDIPAGVSWDYEIQKNFESANIIVLILSKISAQKNGYIRREMNEAIEKLKYYKPDDVRVIPLLIDDAIVPSFISNKIQFIDFKRPDGWDRFYKSLQLAASQQDFELSHGVKFASYTFKNIFFKEEYEHIPGHDIEVNYPSISNTKKPKSSELISGHFQARATNIIFQNRTSPWPNKFDWNEDYKSSYTSFHHDSYNVAFCNENIISILHTIHWYGAGAAHPNTSFDVSNFVITDNDYSCNFNLFELFEEEKVNIAILKIKERLIEVAPQTFWERTGDTPEQSDLDWFTNGISESNLSNFTLNETGITFHFSPYEIHCFAMGTWELFVSFYVVADYLKKDGIYSYLRIN